MTTTFAYFKSWVGPNYHHFRDFRKCCCIAFAKRPPGQQSGMTSMNRNAVMFSHQAEISGAIGHCSLHVSAQSANHTGQPNKWKQEGLKTLAALNSEKMMVCPSPSQGPIQLQRTIFTCYFINGDSEFNQIFYDQWPRHCVKGGRTLPHVIFIYTPTFFKL